MERRKREHRAKHSGGKTMHKWTKEQEQYLLAIMALNNASYEKAASAMKGEFDVDRTAKACEVKHLKMTGKIVRSPKNGNPKRHKTTWKGRQEAYVLENFNQMPIEEIAKHLGRTPKAVKDRYHLLMRVRGTSVVFRNELGNPVLYEGNDDSRIGTPAFAYPEYIPKRWIIKELKRQYRAQIREEKAESKQRIKMLKEQMKEEIRRIKNDE